MKILHTSDWHIGKSVNGYLMLDEQKNVFTQIIEYIRAEKPSAIVIAGDVYDRAVPSVEAVRIFDEFLTGLSKEKIDVFLVAGNHDSPERLNYASRILAELKLHICGTFDGTVRKVALNDEIGKVNFYLLPFIKPVTVRGHYPDKEIESYFDAVKIVLENIKLNASERNVLISHQTFTMAGVSLERSDSEINIIGGVEEVDASILSAFDYVALGHLHRSQNVGKEHIRYAGSPVKYSFSECKHKKCVLMVEIKEKGNVAVKALPLKPIHDLREIKGSFDALMKADEKTVGNKTDYLKIVLTDEDDIIDPMNKLRNVFPNIMTYSYENSRTNIDFAVIGAGAQKVEQLSEYDLFCQFFVDVTGSTMTEEQAEIIRNLLDGEDAR